MTLAIDAAGSVKGCKVVANVGDMTPDYSCKDASRRESSRRAPPKRPRWSARA